MHKLTFFPLGNADCCCICLNGGAMILFDYANTKDPDDSKDLRCDLEQELRESLDDAKRDYYDVVAFTHLDEDHFKGATDFFWLQHANKYQTKDRIKVNVMWVPAAVITEASPDNPEAKIIQAEARYRFKKGKGIRVFSRPDRLQKWCNKNDVDFEARKHLITDAGQLAPEFTKESNGVEFFVHSPFAKHTDDGEIEDRNQGAIVMHATFLEEGIETKVWLMADATHEVIADIVEITIAQDRPERLNWDIAKLPHHCSYLAIGPDKGTNKTKPDEQVERLFREHRNEEAIVVSTSVPIPTKGSEEDKDKNPPHRQAANYYREDVIEDAGSQFKVTMEHPKKSSPKPLVIEIDGSKATIVKRVASIGAAVVSAPAPRAG